jgi:hypothetical protein
VLSMQDELEDKEVVAIAHFWNARCHRKKGEYDEALKRAGVGRELAQVLGFPNMAAVMRVPEVRDCHHFFVFQFILHGKHEIKLTKRLVRIVPQKREQPFRHTQLQIVIHGKMSALLPRKACQHLLNQSRLAISDINPLSKTADKSGRIRLLRADMRKEVFMAVQQFNAAGYVAHHQVVFKFLEKLAGHARILLDIEPGCGHSVENDSTFLSKSSESDDLVCNPSCARI